MKELSSLLLEMGYVRVDSVDYPGQFSVRGGILDVFPPQGPENRLPYRIEFFGDEIDRICVFDPLTQRVTENRDLVWILPVHEVLYGPKEQAAIRKKVEACLKACSSEDGRKELLQELAAIDGGQPLHFVDKYISLIYPQKECLLNYFSKKRQY